MEKVTSLTIIFILLLRNKAVRGFIWAHHKQSKPSKPIHVSPSDQVAEINVRYKSRSLLRYDPTLDRYVLFDEHPREHESSSYSLLSGSISFQKATSRLNRRLVPFLKSSYLPEGVSHNYFSFMKWRILQRFISANLHVLTTQSLLLGLGLKSSMKNRAAALGVSAAVNWVLKDALGKISRMIWASRMGRKFDSDAKRWRFRSALLFAIANYLELITYIYPNFFLLLATCANSLKQISMLTSSATRNAIYNSFRLADDIHARENIGDITAKGEAQIATVDLIGIGSGLILSKLIGIDSVQRILFVYVLLQTLEMICMYREISSVVFNMLNFERLHDIIQPILGQMHQPTLSSVIGSIGDNNANGSIKLQNFAMVPVAVAEKMTVDEMVHLIPTPEEASRREKIFLPPVHLGRRAIAFGSISRAKLSPDELESLLNIFVDERYLLVVGENMKKARPHKLQDCANTKESIELNAKLIREHCHIVLHKDATNLDVVRAILALEFLRQNMAVSIKHTTRDIRTRDCLELIKDAKEQAYGLFPLFLKILEKKGWSTTRFMFGRVNMRADWSIRSAPTERQRIQSLPHGVVAS